MLTIQVGRGTMICVSVFDKIANNLHQKLELAGLEPKVMVATNIKPKVAGGCLFLNAILVHNFILIRNAYPPRVCQQRKIFETQTVVKSIIKSGAKKTVRRQPGSQAASTSTSTKYGSVKKNEIVTFTEFNTYILDSPLQVGPLRLQYIAI